MERLSCKQNNLLDKDYFRKIFATKEFQRLKNISFLGAIDYSFNTNPLAHNDRSRLSHCLSVGELALTISDKRKYSADVEAHLVIAALLHDIGHMPLSHSIERDVKKRYGVDHHNIGSSILRGTSPLGKELFNVLKKYVDVDEVVGLINGESSAEGYELFSNPINIDTIDGITRAARYVDLDAYGLEAQILCLNAFCEDDSLSQAYVDKFWELKGRVYSELILNKQGLLADYLSASYFRDNENKFSEEDFFEDEWIWEHKFPELFHTLRNQASASSECDLNISYQARSYIVVHENSGKDRYICRKTKDVFSISNSLFDNFKFRKFHYMDSVARPYVLA